MSDDRPDSNDQPGSPSEDTTVTSHAQSGRPTRIGPYRILQKIGEGGMGVVFEAEQEGPVHRKVALKIVKSGLDSKQVIARFEAERQALALMNHPNVAKVLDAGETPDGRPYFAMEYVKGVPITDHCDRQRLSTEERLQLFMQVCEGVQHAHYNGIIHRDIKPSNILVTIENGKAAPKIIDFGVAKATAQRLTERTLFTELGQLVGTPEYMSPEQAEMTPQGIDVRTDVYSLGVVLYELLVGALPFDPKELRRAGFDEIRRKIREDQPSKPSARVSTAGIASTASAENRRTNPRSLARQLRGDLDWITMKALEKSPTRRYASSTALLDDIARYLNKQTVLAGPPSAAYRITTFARRNKTTVVAGVAMTALVITGVVIIQESRHRESPVPEHEELGAEVATRAELRRTLEVLQEWDKRILEETSAIRELLTTAGSRVPHEDRQRFVEMMESGQEDPLAPNLPSSSGAQPAPSWDGLSKREQQLKARFDRLTQLRIQVEKSIADGGTGEPTETGPPPVPVDDSTPSVIEDAAPTESGPDIPPVIVVQGERAVGPPPEDDPVDETEWIEQGDLSADEDRSIAVAETADSAREEVNLTELSMADQEIERFLLEGNVVASEKVGTGITKPWKVTLELDGKTMRALFKDIDVEKPGMTRFPGGKSEMNFSDKYIYERAAYLLDRRLDMNMVPVAVKRQWLDKTGAMIEWFEGAISEKDRLEQGIGPDDPVAADHQMAIMRLFDALIYNADRNQTNMLYKGDEWKLHLTDHSRSFRRDTDLPDAFMIRPASLPAALLEALESLDEKELKTLLKNLVSGPQIKSLMQRRDLILEKIAEDRSLYGDDMVLQE
jgi:serine/threonine protein kinase